MGRKAIQLWGITGVMVCTTFVQTCAAAQDLKPTVLEPLAPAMAPSAGTRVPFKPGFMKPGFERLRVVRREDTVRGVGAQVALGIGLSLLTGGVTFGASSFSKDELAGQTPDELQADPAAAHPAMSDLQDALSRVATDIYRRRMEQALATARQDGSTPEEIEEAGRVQPEADTPLHPGAWHLVYENLSGEDELFRMKFGAQLGRAGFMRPPAACGYESAAISWSQWRADDWQLLRDERVKAVARCVEVLGATPEKYW